MTLDPMFGTFGEPDPVVQLRLDISGMGRSVIRPGGR
jgi:hypothetical protein